MSRYFQCAECGVAVQIPRGLKTVRCRRCGDSSFITDGVPRRMYPALHMHPVNYDHGLKDYPSSIWMQTHTRPVRPGIYECRFRHTEPNVIPLLWNGVSFVVPSTGERVVMTQFLTWRGCLV
jgi:hypothetical protein